jgi:mono/diheme cytochrome c family protein
MRRWLLSLLVVLAIWIAFAVLMISTMSVSAGRAGGFETWAISRLKYQKVGGKNASNPLPDTPDTIQKGAEHFQHHCEICHGLDGQNTGVPFADHSLPPVADLASPPVQKYTDGQLKWIIDNGIRFTGMPGWKDILEDDERWAIVRYIRHLPPKGSLGAPKVFEEAEEEHEHTGEKKNHEQQPGSQTHHHEPH